MLLSDRGLMLLFCLLSQQQEAQLKQKQESDKKQQQKGDVKVGPGSVSSPAVQTPVSAGKLQSNPSYGY